MGKRRTAILKRPVAAVGDCNRPAAPKKRRPDEIALGSADCSLPQNRPAWYNSVGGALQPDWAQHFADVLRGPILNLKRKVGEQLRLVVWSDCVGQCTEGTAGKQAADVLMKVFDIKFTMKLPAGSALGTV